MTRVLRVQFLKNEPQIRILERRVVIAGNSSLSSDPLVSVSNDESSSTNSVFRAMIAQSFWITARANRRTAGATLQGDSS